MKTAARIPSKTVSAFTTVVTGGTPSTTNQTYWDGDVPWLNSGALNTGDVSEPSRYITQEGLRNSAARLMPPETVLIALTGATTGQVGYLTFEACANQSVTGILPSAQHHGRYLYHFLRTQRERIRADAFGAAQPHINQQYVKDLEIPLPPLAEQKSIAAILDAADALRAKRRESIEQLDSLVQSTFLEMFGDPVTNPQVTVKPMTAIVARFIDYRGKSPNKVPSGVPLITAKIVKDKVVAVPTEFIPESEYGAWMRRGIPMPEDVIITTEAPMGEVALVPAYRAAFAQRLLVLQPNRNEVTPQYLMWALVMPFVKEQLRRRSTGSTVTGIRSKEFKQVMAPVPPLHLQNRFASIVESIEQQKARLRAHLAELDTLFASLQSRAFNGELVA